MEPYLIPIGTAFLLFPLIALVLTLPYMLYSYRRYGAVSPLRSLVLFSFLLYLLCAYFLVVLPLPNPAKVAQLQTPVAQLVPFTFVNTFLQQAPFVLSNPATYLPTLTSHAFLEPAFNLLLTLPFGVYLCYYFRENLPKTLLATFLLSLFFELTQLSALYGLYPRPYRLFSVDDLMLNTLGGVLGYLLGKEVRRLLPSKAAMDRHSYRRSSQVGYLRRGAANVVDLGLILLFTALAQLAVGPGRLLFPAVFLLYYVVLQGIGQGRALGKWLVRIRVAPLHSTPSRVLWLALRYLLVIGPIWAVELGLRATRGTPQQLWAATGGGLLLLLYLASWALGFARGKWLWYEKLSRTKAESTFLTEDR